MPVGTFQSVRSRNERPAFQLDLVRSLKLHPVLACSVTALSLALLLVYALTMKPVYETEAVIYEQPEPAKLLGENPPPSFDSGKYDSFLEEQIQRLQRPDTIVAALAGLPRSTWAEYGSSQQTAAEGVLAKLNVGRVTTSYQVALKLKGSDPKNITEVLNAIAFTYLDLVQRQVLTDSDERAGLLAEERQRVVSALQRVEQEQTAVSASLGVPTLTEEGDPYEVELAALREQLVQARTAHDTAAAQLSSLGGQVQGEGSALAVAADEAVLRDTGLSALKASVSERQSTLRAQMLGMTPENPLRQRDQDELADLDRSLEEMTTKLRTKAEHNIQEKLRVDVQQTGETEARINGQLTQRTVAALKSTPKLQQAAELNTDLKRLLLRRAEIDDATRGLRFEVNSPRMARLTSAAQIPTSPEGNRRRLLFLASLPLALTFGVTAAATARKYNGRIYTSPDVESALGFPPLAVLPARDEVSEEQLSQDVLRIAGCMETAHRTKGVRSFLLTAVSSHTDIESLSRELVGKLREMGMNACQATSADLLLPVQLDRSAPVDTSSTISSAMPVLTVDQGFVSANLTLMQASHSLVLIQAATLGDSAETEYVARCADATILFAQSAVTTRGELLHAAELLQRLQVPGLGIVLQEVRKRFVTPRRLEAFRMLRVTRTTQKSARQQSEPVLDQKQASGSSSAEHAYVSPVPVERQPTGQSDVRETVFADPDAALLVDGKQKLNTLESFCEELQNVDGVGCSADNASSDTLSNSANATELGPQSAITTWFAEVSLGQTEVTEMTTPVLFGCSGISDGCPAVAGLLKSQPMLEEPYVGNPANVERRPQQSRDASGGTAMKADEVVERELQAGLHHSGLVGEGSQQRVQNQLESDRARSQRVTELTPSPKHDEERESTQLTRVETSRRWLHFPLLRSTELPRQNDFSWAAGSYDTVADPAQLESPETPSHASHGERFGERGGMLTRQWSLLSRFQQMSACNSGFEYTQQREGVEPGQTKDTSHSFS